MSPWSCLFLSLNYAALAYCLIHCPCAPPLSALQCKEYNENAALAAYQKRLSDGKAHGKARGKLADQGGDRAGGDGVGGGARAGRDPRGGGAAAAGGGKLKGSSKSSAAEVRSALGPSAGAAVPSI